MPTDPERAERHRRAMARKKAHVDARIEAADIERGVVVVLTGDGKGKTSSGFGMLTRALGHGMQCAVAQFIKGQWQTGEMLLLADHPGVRFVTMASGFTWDTQDRDADIAAAEATWQEITPALADPAIGFVLLDELTYMLTYGYLDTDAVVGAIRERPEHQHVVITGRNANDALRELADTLSEVRAQKHAFDAGIKAQPGVEY